MSMMRATSARGRCAVALLCDGWAGAGERGKVGGGGKLGGGVRMEN